MPGQLKALFSSGCVFPFSTLVLSNYLFSCRRSLSFDLVMLLPSQVVALRRLSRLESLDLLSFTHNHWLPPCL